jgi:hypothetical protein
MNAPDMTDVKVKLPKATVQNLRLGKPLQGDFQLNQEFTAEVVDPRIPYVIKITVGAFEGRLIAESVEIGRQPNGPPVTGTALRSIPVETYLVEIRRRAARGHAGLILPRVVEEGSVSWRLGATVEEAARLESAHSKRRSTDETLRSVVNTYRAALADPDLARRPTEATAEQLGYTRGHVSKVLTNARKLGLLGEAEAGRAGERL